MRTVLLLLTVLTGCVHSDAPTVPSGETVATTAAEAARKQQAQDNPTLYASSKVDEPTQEAPAAIRVQALPDGSYTVDGISTPAESLEQALRGVTMGPAIEVVVVDNAPYEMVIFAIDAARAAGHENFVMTPEPVKTDAP